MSCSPTVLFPLSLHDALPICAHQALEMAEYRHGARKKQVEAVAGKRAALQEEEQRRDELAAQAADRKSTRLNSSHVSISYAVFSLKKKILLHILINNV